MADGQDPMEHPTPDSDAPDSNADAALSQIAAVAREQVLIGLESITTSRPALSDVSYGAADPAGVAAEFDAIPHAGIEVSLAMPSGAALAGVVLVPLADLGALVSIETGAEQMEDAEFASAQMELVSASAREFFDLMSMTLFVDGMQGIEAVPGTVRTGDAVATVGAVAQSAGDAGIVRIDMALALASGEAVHVVVLLPQTFLDAIGVARIEAATADEAEAPAAVGTSLWGESGDDVDGMDALDSLDALDEAPAPMPGATPRMAAPADDLYDDDAFGLDGDPTRDFDNISPLRPAGTFGAGAREDVDVHPVRFPPLSEPSLSNERRTLDLIMDVSMRVTVELGRSTLTVEEVLALGPGSVVELNKLAGEPVDVLVNEQLIARGEVVVVDENFGVRVTEIVSPRRRAQAMGA
ncbi:MAG: flagellar motor switch protein FliN [Dehalococcoidia bacterium]